MKIVYTGATSAQLPQQDASASIGGYRSSSIIPNERKGNLFSEISYLGMSNEYSECKGMVLYNDEGVLSNMKIGVFPQTATLNYKIMIAVVTLSNDQMEKLPNMQSIPYNATFYELYMQNATDVANMLNIGAVAAGAYFGVWMIRQLRNGVNDTNVYNDVTGGVNYFGKLNYISPADDTATYSNPLLVSTNIDVYRGGILQSAGTGYTFDNTGGVITFIPVLAAQEVVEIRQITNISPATPDFSQTTNLNVCEWYANAVNFNKMDGFDFIVITS